MRPLNGRCAMTREEKNARRRELDRNPFHKALSRKYAKKWRDSHKEELNARRRAKYAESDSYREANRKWAAANRDKKRASWKRWADNNRERLRAKDRAYYAAHSEKIRLARKNRVMTPERLDKVRAGRRSRYHKNKSRPIGFRWFYLQMWRKLWTRLIDQGEAAIERYHRRTTIRNWYFFTQWRRGGEAALEQLWGVKF